MNGLYLTSPGALDLKEFSPQKDLKENEVKIKLIYGGICGSDLSVYKGKLAHANYPVIPGHEIIGTVVEKGSNVTLNVGDRVVIEPNTFCGECDNCRAGRTNICFRKESLGVNKNGGFIEELVIEAKYAFPLPDALSNEKAILIEPLSVVVHAFKRTRITKDQNLAVIGCGTEGMLSVALADYFGAKVTAVDINPKKLEKINRYYKQVKTCLSDELEDSTFDVVIEAAGSKESFEKGIQILKPGKSMVVIGMTPTADFPVVQFVRKELSIYGSIIYNYPEDFQKSIDYLMNDSFNVTPVISKILPFKEFKKAYELALTGEFTKFILNFEEVQS